MKHLHRILATVLLCGITTLSLAKTPHVVKKAANHSSASAQTHHAGQAKAIKAKSPAAKAGKTAAKKTVHSKAKLHQAKADKFDNPNSKGPGLEAF